MLESFFYILIACLGLLHLGMLGLLAYGVWRVHKRGSEIPEGGDLPPLSVLIAARNEAANLAQYLPSILNQRYPTFEVIVILNHTTDESMRVLRELSGTYECLKWVEVEDIPRDWPAKKWALQKGAEVAQYKQLVLTDADCWVEQKWLQRMGERVSQGYEWILGVGLYEQASGWLGKWISYETHYTAFQYLGATGIGIPYMAVGRNLSYPRSILMEQEGLTKTRDSLSGDDDLLVNTYATADKTAGMFKEGGRSWSAPAKNWKNWWAQKTRHVSASNHYSLKTKTLLAFLHLSHVTFYGFCVIGIAMGVSIAYIGGMILSMLILRGSLLFSSPLSPSERGLQWYFLGLEISQFLYNLSVVPIGLLRRPTWKTRS